MQSLAQEVHKHMQQRVNKGTDEGTTDGKKKNQQPYLLALKNIAPRKFRDFI